MLTLERYQRVLRSAAVGLVATLVDLAALSVLISAFAWTPRSASLPALALGVATQFVGNKIFAFRNRERAWLRQGAKFAIVEAASFSLNIALFDIAVTRLPLPPVAVRLVTTSVVYFAFCLPLWSHIFREKRLTQ